MYRSQTHAYNFCGLCATETVVQDSVAFHTLALLRTTGACRSLVASEASASASRFPSGWLLPEQRALQVRQAVRVGLHAGASVARALWEQGDLGSPPSELSAPQRRVAQRRAVCAAAKLTVGAWHSPSPVSVSLAAGRLVVLQLRWPSFRPQKMPEVTSRSRVHMMILGRASSCKRLGDDVAFAAFS